MHRANKNQACESADTFRHYTNSITASIVGEHFSFYGASLSPARKIRNLDGFFVPHAE